MLLAYVPDVGHGFVKDDFAWILRSRIDGIGEVASLFKRSDGFFRPIVGLSFALNERLCGLDPRCFGLTNLSLAFLVAAEIFMLARVLGLSFGAAAAAASLWVLNWHGVSMAVLWISGRTSLLLLVFALASALAVMRGWWILAGLAVMLALFSKEEAVLLPAILLFWTAMTVESGRLALNWKRSARWAVPLLVPLVVYFVVRAGTGAYLPSTAPPFYKPTLAPALLGRNLVEYADRAGTVALIAVVMTCAVARRLPTPTLEERRLLWLGLIWCLGGYGLTLFLPVRSSLYALFPAVGVTLVAAVLCASVWRRAGAQARRVLTVGAAILPLGLVPLYRSRNVRWVGAADLSTAVLGEVQKAAATAPAGAVLLLRDDLSHRYNVTNSFGTLIEDAAKLFTSGRIQRAWVEPPAPDWRLAGLRPPEPGEPVVCRQLNRGAVSDCDETGAVRSSPASRP